MKCDTYLQELLAAGNIDECYVGQNVVQSLLADPGDFEAPPTIVFEVILILNSEDGHRYGITSGQLGIEKDLMIGNYPEEAETILTNYNAIKAKMEVAE